MMNIQKIQRRKYSSSFLNSVQLVIAFPNNERTTSLQTSVVKFLVEVGFDLSSFNESEQIIRAKRDDTSLVVSNVMLVLTVGTQDYVSFENYSKYTSLVKNLVKLMHIDEMSTLLFQKRNSYPFKKAGFKTTPSKEEVFNSVFSAEFMKEHSTMMFAESDTLAYMAQRRYSESEEYYLAESMVSAIQMNAIGVDELDAVLAEMNDELFAIWSVITSDDVKKIMEGK